MWKVVESIHAPDLRIQFFLVISTYSLLPNHQLRRWSCMESLDIKAENLIFVIIFILYFQTTSNFSITLAQTEY
jgi:hypothetical protein